MYFERYLNDLDTFFMSVTDTFWNKTDREKLSYYF